MSRDLIVNGELVLFGAVGSGGFEDEFSAREVIEALSRLDGRVAVRVNSGGGDVFEAVSIYNALKARPDWVTAIVDGVAASAASLIVMGADEIVMTEGSLMMIHDPSALTVGPASTHEKTAGLLDKVADEIAAIYAERSGVPVSRVREMMREETWMTPAEAVELGFADRVDEAPALAAAAFDYRIYARAPKDLVALAAKTCGGRRAKRDGARSAVTILAASAASHPEQTEVEMTEKKGKGSAGSAAEDRDKITETPAAEPRAGIDEKEIAMKAEKAAAEAVARERERVRSIRHVGMALGIDEAEVARAIEDGEDSAAFQARAIDMVAELRTAGGGGGHGIMGKTASVTVDERDKWHEGVTRALMAKAGLKGGERNEFSALTLRELARESLRMAGERSIPSDVRAMVGRVFTMAGSGHSTSDFPAVLANVANKALLQGYEEAEETFPLWTRTGSLPDFKVADRVDIGAFPSLAKKVEGAEYNYVTVGERKEQIVLATYGAIFQITREAIIDNNLSAFTRIPAKMGRAARRTVGDLVYAVLTSNPTMSDGKALFHSSHGNLASAGAAPSVDTWDEARAAMATQKDGDAVLNIRPRYTIVPVALEGKSFTIANSEFIPSDPSAANPVRGMVEIVSDARLDADSTTAWYMAADPNAFDTIEVAYLDGQEEPFLEQRSSWSTDGAEFKVRIDAGVAPLDWRTLYKNPGA